MSLSTGDKLGPYEILSPLGAGGMGEVYLARDGKLDREVAIKVLPEVMARDKERVARFEREARLLASLNHPSIAAIHGFDSSDGTRFLVMEYVEGETLASHLKNGPVAVEDALDIAKQIAEALEAAHGQGVIHRDLKPANVMIREDGTVKVLDFGLAKAMADGSDMSESDRADSPTITVNFTRPGVVLGTAAYMSPEQARGRALDKRTDIWSFGIMLFECLSGDHLFQGETANDSIGAILHKDPDWSLLPPDTPPTIQLLLRRCLTKDRKRRLHDIADARIELENAIVDPTSSSLGIATAAINDDGFRRKPKRTPVAATLIATALIGIGIAGGWLLKPARSNHGRIVSQIPAPKDSRIIFVGDTAGATVVSPNGRMLAFVAQPRGKRRQLWLHDLAEQKAQPLSGTEKATFPFWSPNNQSIAFFAAGKLKIIDLRTSTTTTVCDAPGGRGGTWFKSNVIVFAPEFQGGIMKVPHTGGTPVPVTQVDPNLHSSHRWPASAGDDNHFFFTAINHNSSKSEHTAIYLGSLDGSPPKRVVKSFLNAEYAAGKLLFVRETVLMATPFNIKTATTTGDAVAIAGDVTPDLSTWRAAFSVSETGLIAYHSTIGLTEEGALSTGVPLGAGAEANVIVKYGRDGKPIQRLAEGTSHGTMRLSADGKRLALSVIRDHDSGIDIWVGDASFEMPQRVTAMQVFEESPVWSPDSEEIAFLQEGYVGDVQTKIARKRIGGGTIETLLEAEDGNRQVWPTDWSNDGKYIIYSSGIFVTGVESDIHVLPLDGGNPFPIVATSKDEYNARLSPSGKWLAYCSREKGQIDDSDVFVIPFTPESPPRLQDNGDTIPAPQKWQISSGGGKAPCWSTDGTELFYISGEGELNAVAVETETDTFKMGTITTLFQTAFEPGKSFGVVPGSKEFYFNEVSVDVETPITLIVNWDQDQKQ